ncbi:MAG: 5-deoxy-glucuronate isomerase [Thermomicrobiales bacterium]
MAIADPRALLLHSNDLYGNSGTLIDVSVESAGWEYCGLRVLRLASGEAYTQSTGPDEVCLVPLAGACSVSAAGQTWQLGERESPVHGKPWGLYLPLQSEFEVIAETPLELAITSARAEVAYPPKLITPDDVAVEIRGAGNAARQINHIIAPGFPADKLLVVEVFTPSGNWSSYPPHKHDVHNMPAEADLEEIYYYRIYPGDGFGLQRLHTADGSVDEAYVIKDGDLLLVPEGYHTFAVAQGYTGYYLNILAGDEPVRTMQPSDDPGLAWVRATWNDEINAGLASWQDIDDRINGDAGKRK